MVIDKKDPILLALEKETSQFDPNIYIKKNDDVVSDQSLWLTIESYYQTRFENIRGSLIFKLDHLVFEAYKQKDKTEEEQVMFNLMIDYLDIVSVSILKIPNEEAADHPEKFVRANYKFNFLLQIEVSAINGLSAVENIFQVEKSTG